MSEQVRAYSRARPVRVAYLVEEQADGSSAMLDAIFAECMGRWGGRFSLIVPASSEGPYQTYEPWLEAFDPDVIYSYVALSEAAVERVHERLYPSFLIRHEFLRGDERDAYAFRPELPVKALSVTTLLPRAAAPGFDGVRGIRVIEAYGRMSCESLVQDSFGFFTTSVGRSFGPPFGEFGAAMTMVADDEAQPRARYFRDDALTVNSTASLLETMATNRVVTMSQLAAMAAPRLGVRSRRAGAFNLVVGDTFVDRVFYWNARSLFPKWLDGDWVDLRLQESALDDPVLIAALGELLQRRNRVSDGSSSSNPRVLLRSSSVTRERLDALATALRGAKGWMNFSVGPGASLDECVPSRKELRNAPYVISEGLFGHAVRTWHESQVVETNLELAPSAPEHLRYCPPSLVSPHSGCWAVDIDIERRIDHSKYVNVRHRWRMPRRLRITRAFLKGYETAGGGIVMPRVERDGLLTTYADAGSKFPTINLPTDEIAIRTALIEGRDWWPFERKMEEGAQMPAQLLSDAHRSPSGRQFWGVLGLMGNLNKAQSVLLHSFWRDVFEKLGGSPASVEARRDIVLRRLEKRVQTLTPGSERDMNKLAGLVMEEAEHFRTSVPSLNWTELERMFAELQEKAWQEDRGSHMTDAERQDWRQHERHHFRERVKDLCRRGVLHQGYEHRCHKCLHRSWIAIDALRGEIICEVCRERQPAPVDCPWDFRLNEFLREGLRKHGVLPLVWTLAKVRPMVESCLFFEGPLEVYTEKTHWEGGRPLTDIDLICVTDGVVRMCEVKQSARQLYSNEIERFAGLMNRLRPDIAVMAVMEPDNATIRKHFGSFREQLANTGIQAELLTFDESRDLDRDCSV